MLNELETTEEKFAYIFIFEVSPGSGSKNQNPQNL